MPVEPIGLAKEEQLQIPLAGAGVECLVVSGYATFSPFPSDVNHWMGGDEDDDAKAVPYTVHMTVGPTWLAVRDVSPIVSRAGYYHGNPDSADQGGYEINGCSWDTIGLPPPNTNLERIRLKVELSVRGGKAHRITHLAYHFVAVGTIGSA